jgi:hypothetical protein
MYYGWFDDNPKTPAALKIQDAIDAYIRRFSKRPNVVLVNEADIVELQGMTIRPESFIRRNNFWVGYEEVAKAVEPAEPLPVAPVVEVLPQKRASRKATKLAA